MTDTRHETEVPTQCIELGLLDYLSQRFSYQSRTEWEGHLLQGRLELNGRPCTTDRILQSGDRLAFTPPEFEEPPVPQNWTILFEDDAFVFIDKPAGLPCHPSGIYRSHTLWNLLQPVFGSVHLVNRLDRETSGVIVAAKTGEWAAKASAELQGAGAIRRALAAESAAEGAAENLRTGFRVKEYRVVVEGTVREPIDARGYLIRDTASPVRKKLSFSSKQKQNGGEPTGGNPPCSPDTSKYVHTRFFPLTCTDGMSELRAELITGKTHQIRATLQGLGFPVVGDKLYGKDPTAFLRFIDGTLTERDLAMLRIDRQALHCERMAFTLSPERNYDITAPVPADWPIRN